MPPDRLRVVPILHGRFEFAVEVRRAFAEHAPTDVVVELPAALSRSVKEAVHRLPQLSVIRVVHPEETSPLYLLIEPTDGLVEAVRLALENDVQLLFADRDSAGVVAVRQAFPDPHAIETLGLEGYAGPCMQHSAMAEDAEDMQRERTMAYHLTTLLARPERRVLFVCGLSHARPVMDRVGAETAVPFGRPARLSSAVFHLHPDSSREVLTEMPFLSAAYESWRAGQKNSAVPPTWPLPRQSIHLDMIREARRHYQIDDGEDLSPHSLANLFRFARNCSVLEGGLAPDFFNLVLASRGVADDNFAYHVWNTGSTYPHAQAMDRRPSLRITLEDLERSGRLVRFRRKLKRTRPVMRLVRQRRQEKHPGEWREKWSGLSMCSHPPEDIVIEGYGRFLARKAKGILAADRTRTEPFTTSLLDGIDFRETIRNRIHDGRIYVRDSLPVKGEIGSVVIAFDPVDSEERYPYRMTWQGEHDQESDMALYSTIPGEQVAGPGISRCEYGGFLLTWPPGRMFYIWEDPEFTMAASPGEHLLLAGIDYSQERMVVYVSPSPPRPFVRQYAARRDRKVIYVPLGQLSPVTLKRIRTFHVLDGKHVRTYAREYIW